MRVDGRPGRFDHSAAYGQWGDVMLELVTVHDPAGTPEGLHHLAFFVDDIGRAGEACAARGWAEALWAATPGGTPFAHHDARAELGHYVEIYTLTPSLRRLFDLVREASIDHDGRDPVRDL